MPYEAINFQDAPSTITPLNAATLNQLDQGMLEAHDFMRPHTYAVILQPGWTSNVNVNPGTPQVFRKRAGVVIAELAIHVPDPTVVGITPMSVPEEVRPSIDVHGVALVSTNGTIQPAGYTISSVDGSVNVDGLPTAQPFVLLLNLVYFV